ncbi:MAG TPA: 4Fe-4S dicluster domain-containing protein [Desulfobacteraceae bacterium]|nr:4Fe-4S dicluster domain-containing protein [Desulfobacteraceae bacterium]
MDKKRREFLKIVGISTLAGLGAPAVFDRLVSGSHPVQARASATGAQGGAGGQQAAAAGHSQAAAGTGKRYGMVIDVRKFKQYPDLARECVRVCHAVHNVPHFPDRKEEIKWIWQTPYTSAFTEHSHYYRDEDLEQNQVLVLCNHCDNPPCVRVCPTKATFRNEDGIVEMDYHRCIGCRFCMAGCPYGARSFNWRDPRQGLDMNNLNRQFPTRMRGVVEKCNFCVERLGRGQIPACVEATGNTGAMYFGDLNDPDSEIRRVLKENFTIQRKPSLGTLPSVFFII